MIGLKVITSFSSNLGWGGDRIFLVKDEASGDNFGRFDGELDILDMD